MNEFSAAPAAPSPSGSGVEDEIAAAMASLDTLDGLPIPQHVEVFTSVHEVLSTTLSAVDEA